LIEEDRENRGGGGSLIFLGKKNKGWGKNKNEEGVK